MKRAAFSLGQKVLKGGWVLFFLSSRSTSFKDNLVSFTRCVYESSEIQSLWESAAARGRTALSRWKPAKEKHRPRVQGWVFRGPWSQLRGTAHWNWATRFFPLGTACQKELAFTHRQCLMLPKLQPCLTYLILQDLKLDVSNWQADFISAQEK